MKTLKNLLNDIKDNRIFILEDLFIILFILCNIVANKLIYIFGVAINVGTFIYIFTFIISNYLNNKLINVRRLILKGLYYSVITSIILLLLDLLPGSNKEAFNIILGCNYIFVIGSLTAYIISHLINAKLFNKLRFNNMPFFIKSALTSYFALAIDTVIFNFIAFGLGFGWIWSNLGGLLWMTICQMLIKWIVSLTTNLFTIKTK